jgi:hypothetical protein
MVAEQPYQKDYDAIVTMLVGNQLYDFALEYRRKRCRCASAIQEIDFPSGDSTATGGWEGRLKLRTA